MDYMLRATAANGQIQAFACITRETVETARMNHDTSPVVTAALGRLLSAVAMMGKGPAYADHPGRWPCREDHGGR